MKKLFFFRYLLQNYYQYLQVVTSKESKFKLSIAFFSYKDFFLPVATINQTTPFENML